VKELESIDIRIDQEGDWFYEGRWIFRPEILEALYAKLDRLPTGEFILCDLKGTCLLEVADTPFVVSRVDFERNGSGAEQIVIRFKNILRSEVLDPETLVTGKGNVLYCRLADKRFSARFSRPAYYQLAQFVSEDDTGNGFYIELNGKRYPISVNSGE
jgi:hypothetical protein